MVPTTPNLLVTIAALMAVLALVLGCAKFVRWSRNGRLVAGRRLRLIETLPVDRARRLQIVQCDGQELLLLVGGGADLLLGPIPAFSDRGIGR